MEQKPFDTLGQIRFTNNQNSKELASITFTKEVVSRYYGKEPSYLDITSRKREFVKVRQVCMYLLRDIFKLSYVRIGMEFNKDHATIIYSCKLVSNFLEYDKMLQHEVEELRKILSLKGQAHNCELDLSSDFYFIDLNNCVSIKAHGQRALLLTGFTDEEIKHIKIIDTRDNVEWTSTENEQSNERKHENTGLYILEELTKKEKDGN